MQLAVVGYQSYGAKFMLLFAGNEMSYLSTVQEQYWHKEPG